MLERDMEELIANYPAEFLPDHGLTLTGRQQTFAGVGRFDLLFRDRFGTNVLMELKAVAAKYENATQLAKNKEALEAQGHRDILMWLVAPSIGTSVREFRDRIGIEYSEMREVQFRRVAQRYGLQLQQMAGGHERIRAATPAPSGPAPALPEAEVADEVTATDDYELREGFDRAKLSDLLARFESSAKRKIDRSLAANLRRELIEPHAPMLTVKTLKQLARWCKTDGIYSEGMAVAREISRLLFGVVIDRHRLGT